MTCPNNHGSTSASCSSSSFSSTEGGAETECTTLVDAINEKYGSCELQSNVVLPAAHHENCSNSNKKSFFIKIKAGEHLSAKKRELFVLNDQNINRAGDLNELSVLLQNVTHLDLSRNLLSSYNELCQILSRTPLLKHCDLSHNSLSEAATKNSDDYYKRQVTSLPRLTRLVSLVLNATHIEWLSLIEFLRAAPCLEELHLSLNNYSDAERQLAELIKSELQNEADHVKIDGHVTISFPTIHVLHINRCRIEAWSTILTICRLFPCLEILIAAENLIKNLHTSKNERDQDRDITGYGYDDIKETFACLHALNVNKWPVETWREVDKLRHFPLLSELRVSGLALMSMYEEDERRMLTVARLPDITVLNGSAVSPAYREDAERYFIRYYLDKDEKPDRYYELENVHGRLSKLLDVDLSPKRSAEVHLIYEDENRSEIRCVNLNQTVAQFKKSLKPFCDLPPNRIRLWYLDVETTELGMNELKYPRVMLHALRVSDGDEFHIQAKPEHVSHRRTTSGSTSNSPTKL